MGAQPALDVAREGPEAPCRKPGLPGSERPCAAAAGGHFCGPERRACDLASSLRQGACRTPRTAGRPIPRQPHPGWNSPMGWTPAMAQRLQDCYGQLAQLGYRIAGLDAVRTAPGEICRRESCDKTGNVAATSPGSEPVGRGKTGRRIAPQAAAPGARTPPVPSPSSEAVASVPTEPSFKGQFPSHRTAIPASCPVSKYQGRPSSLGSSIALSRCDT